MDAPIRIASEPDLKEGVLLDNKAVTLELVRSSAGKPPLVVTVSARPYLSKDKKTTYFNVDPPKGLDHLLAQFIDDYKPGSSIGLHRLVAAAAGKRIRAGWEVHHRDHNHLDNRAKNLKPIPADEHKAYHDNPDSKRLPETQQLRLFRDSLRGLFLRITYKATAPHHAPLGYGDGGEGAGAMMLGSPLGLCNVGRLASSGQPGVEPSFDLSRGADGLVLDYAPTLGLRQLKVLGLRGKRGERAARVLDFIARQEGLTKFSAIQAAFCPKLCTRSTLLETLRDLASRGLLIHVGHRYGLHQSATRLDQHQ